MKRSHYHCLFLIYLLITQVTAQSPFPQAQYDYYGGGNSGDSSSFSLPPYHHQYPNPALSRPLERQQTIFAGTDDTLSSAIGNGIIDEDPEIINELNIANVSVTVPPSTSKGDTDNSTTLAPFTLADVKVPTPFLRIEYMISYTFLGVMYGLGFFVLFQSLCVPAAKIAVLLVYILLVKTKSIDPVTLEQALEQLPPT